MRGYVRPDYPLRVAMMASVIITGGTWPSVQAYRAGFMTDGRPGGTAIGCYHTIAVTP